MEKWNKNMRERKTKPNIPKDQVTQLNQISINLQRTSKLQIYLL